ncbi:acetyl CoA:N6-hydroxylysine acetyl transferase [Oxalobacteraceae bacterium GrIS 1.11]
MSNTTYFRSAILAAHPFDVHYQDAALTVSQGGQTVLQLGVDLGQQCCLSRLPGVPGQGRQVEALLAALETVSATHPGLTSITLRAEQWGEVAAELSARGIALPDGAALTVDLALLWQLPELWLAKAAQQPYPQAHRRSGERWHPLRPPKPASYVYERYIPWLGQSIAFRVASVEQDLDILHKWMNDPRVAQFFQEEGDLDYHRRYLHARLDDPHMLPLIAEFDRVPFGYMEVYWAQENRLGPYYDAHDYDRGWHVLVGEAAYSGGQWISAWLPSLMHYMFLDEPRSQRIVGEPAASHLRQIRNLERSGFAALKDVEFPHKRATLVMLLREKYFANRLWRPNSLNS